MSSCSQEEQLNTSFEVQPDDMVERHGDGEHNPLERPRASKEDDNMAADGTLQVDQEGDFVFLTEVRMDLETSQVAARHFELAIFRQQQGTISRCKDRGGDYPIQADFAGNPKTASTTRITACEEAAISRQHRGATSTKQNKQFDPEE